MCSSPQPLDLSMAGGRLPKHEADSLVFANRYVPVIIPPSNVLSKSDDTFQSSPPSFTAADATSTFEECSPRRAAVMPTCVNPNLNSNWIAIKFGAAVGPNRMSYPREFKLMVIDYYYTNGQNKYRTCKEFQITKSMLNGWLQKIDKIRQSRPGSLKSGRSGRRPQFPDIERQLYSLYQTHLASGQKVGNRWIRETARTLAQQQCSATELAGMCQFSERWLSNFKKRYKINLNRDWSSGSSLTASSASSTSSNGSAPAAPDVSSPQVDSSSGAADAPDHAANDSAADDSDDDADDAKIIVDDEDDSADDSPAEPAAVPPPSAAPLANNDPPRGIHIHEFYRQFPWLWRRNSATNYEPGRRGRKVQFPQVEKVLYQKLIEQRLSGRRVSNRWLQEEARAIAEQLCPDVLAEATKSARCLFSEHWLHNFKKRFGVSLKHPSAAQRAAGVNVDRCSTDARPKSVSPAKSAASPPADDATDGAAPQPVDAAGLFRMQQWLVQQCYLAALTAGSASTPEMAAGTAPAQTLLAAKMTEWYRQQAANTSNGAAL